MLSRTLEMTEFWVVHSPQSLRGLWSGIEGSLNQNMITSLYYPLWLNSALTNDFHAKIPEKRLVHHRFRRNPPEILDLSSGRTTPSGYKGIRLLHAQLQIEFHNIFVPARSNWV